MTNIEINPTLVNNCIDSVEEVKISYFNFENTKLNGEITYNLNKNKSGCIGHIRAILGRRSYTLISILERFDNYKYNILNDLFNKLDISENQKLRFIEEKQIVKEFKVKRRGNLVYAIITISYKIKMFRKSCFDFLVFNGANKKQIMLLKDLFYEKGSHKDMDAYLTDKAKYLLSLSEESLKFGIQKNFKEVRS
jgi:hypothetical protein